MIDLDIKTNTTLHQAELFSHHSGKRLINQFLKYFFVPVRSKCVFLCTKTKCPEGLPGRRKGGILQTMGLEEVTLKEGKIY